MPVQESPNIRPLTDRELDAVVGGFVAMDPVGLTAAVVKATRSLADLVGGPLVRNSNLPTL